MEVWPSGGECGDGEGGGLGCSMECPSPSLGGLGDVGPRVAGIDGDRPIEPERPEIAASSSTFHPDDDADRATVGRPEGKELANLPRLH